MGIDFIEIGRSILSVLAVGLLFGAGLPALFAVGMRLVAAGSPDGDSPTAGTPTVTASLAYRLLGYFLYAVVIAVIFLGILWITRQTLYHHLDWQIFPAGAYK